MCHKVDGFQVTYVDADRHEHLSLKVPNVEFDFNVCVDNSMLGFGSDKSKPNVEIEIMSPDYSMQMRS